MKFKLVAITLSLVFQPAAYSASFNYGGEVIVSSISVNTIECGSYEVDLVHDSFPFKHENHVPNEFLIKGFYGSATTVTKQAIVQPAGIIVPNANDLVELAPSYPEGRTYLASSAACKGKQLIVSYWSGGNCSQCEAFVSFEYSGSKLLNPKKVTYREFQALSQ